MSTTDATGAPPTERPDPSPGAPDAPVAPGAESVAIRLVGVSKRFRGSDGLAVDDLTLEVPKGRIVVLVGPSGCGKTTTLKMINRLVEPTAGEISVEGRDVRSLAPAELRRGIGYVIQQVGLFPHRTIAQNIATVPKLLGWDRDRIRRRVAELGELVGLDADLLDRYPHETSGGQQQRVGVARALAADPPVLLMDEPYSAVDPIVRARLQDELVALQRRVHKTIVLVTHDIDEAISLGDRIAIFAQGGTLAQYGTPRELLAAPATEFVASFLGRERGLKQLGLVRAGDVERIDGPVVDVTDLAAAAHRSMSDVGVDWAAVRDGGQVRGWIEARDLDGHAHVADVAVRPFAACIDPATPLREALDLLVRNRTKLVAVVDEGRPVGFLTVDRISEGVG